MIEKLTNSYLLFIAIVITIILTIVNNTSTQEIFVIFQLSAIMVLIGLKVANIRNKIISKTYYFYLVLTGVSAISESFYFTNLIPSLSSLFLVVGTGIQIFVLTRGWILLLNILLHERKVTFETIATALSAYLLIGIAWASLYFTIWQFSPRALHISVARDYDYKPWNLVMYFSFSTLTTVGYGDIVPAGRWIMVLAIFEAILGAIFLAIVVARLVSIYSNTELLDG